MRGNCKTHIRTVAASATGVVTADPLDSACRGGRDSTGFCNYLMNKTIKTLAIVAAFCFCGLLGFPQEVQQDETSAAQSVVVEDVAFPILIRLP